MSPRARRCRRARRMHCSPRRSTCRRTSASTSRSSWRRRRRRAPGAPWCSAGAIDGAACDASPSPSLLRLAEPFASPAPSSCARERAPLCRSRHARVATPELTPPPPRRRVRAPDPYPTPSPTAPPTHPRLPDGLVDDAPPLPRPTRWPHRRHPPGMSGCLRSPRPAFGSRPRALRLYACGDDASTPRFPSPPLPGGL